MSHDNTTRSAPRGTEEAAHKRLEDLLRLCVARDASDLHLVQDERPYLRVHGPLQPLDGEAILDRQEMAAIGHFLAPRFEHVAEGHGTNGSVDGSFSANDGTRFRFNIYRRSGGLAIALRRLEERFRGLAELGLPESLYRLCDLPSGLVVVSGATGAGKSTTLATLIDRINRNHPCHIITIEDPIEYVHSSAQALVNQRQVGTDAGSFNEALVASLRQDPDVVLVGEIRDLDTIRTAITAAETGHLVFTTVHAGDCVSTIERLVGVFPGNEQDSIRQQLALVLRCVVNQRLLVADGATTHTAEATAQRQRVVASEVMFVTSAVANLIVTGRGSQMYSAIEAGGNVGMQTYEQDFARLWFEGKISERTATTAAKRADLVRDRHLQLQRKSGRPVAVAGRPASASGGRS